MSNICDDLRAAILQAAMQGKLTERFPDEKLDQKTRDALCSDIKNAPFEIPESWGYVNMGNVATHQNGYAFKPTDWKKEGLPIIRIQNLTDKKNTPHYTDGHGVDDKFHITKGDVLVSWSCTIDSFLYDGPDAVLNQHIFKVIFNKIPIDKKYYILGVKALLKTIDSKRHGSTMTHITKKDYDSLLFPIPPLAEQKRIVEKVDELMARVADLEQSADALASLKKAFPDDIKASLLQAAMQGKLTEQLPEDGDAEELLDQIKVEKEKLIAEGKIRKQKSLAPIADGETPFSIPDSWRWSRLENVISFIGDKTNQIKESDARKEGTYPVVSQSKEIIIGYHNDKNKVLCVNEPVLVFGDHTALVKYIDFDFILGADGVKVMKPICIKPLYLYYVLTYNLIGVSSMGGYSRHYKFIKDKLVPIPPLAEQDRIINKLGSLMKNIDAVRELITGE